MKKEKRGITTKELIAKLLEIDPSGNKEIYLESGDDYCSGWLDGDNIQVDNDNNSVIFY